MASLRTRQLRDGSNSHTVTWRDPDKGLQSRTYHDKDKAQELKDFLDANGNSFKLAAQAKIRKDSTSPTIAEVVAAHIDLLRKPQPGTVAKYRRMAEAHINGSALGLTPVDRVDKAAVTRWFDQLTIRQGANQKPGRPLSRKTKLNIHALLSAAFKTAVDNGTMTGNPAKGVGEADRSEAREPVYLSPEDLELLAAEVPKEHRLFLRFLSGTGLRYNEATALRRRDIVVNDGRCIIRVTRAWKSVGKGEEIGPPKTKKGRRNVTCNLPLSAELIAHIADAGPDDLVFTRPTGEYLRNAWFHKVVWQPLVTRLVEDGSLERKPWIHEIRHAHTTHLLQRGVPVHVVQARLGHEDPQTTLRVYSRLANDDDLAAADALV